MAIEAAKGTWNFDNTYLQLPPKFFSEQQPEPVPQPELIRFNEELAKDLGLATLIGSDPEKLAAILSGNTLPTGAQPLAQAYAGHQFSHFTMLGDGRAILLGEQLSPANQRFDIQLKGSGRTPFSRRGDGRATLYSMLREYLISEAMHHLGIPSSRSLAIVKTGLPVYREGVHDGAVLTRVSSSHIRVGTFEYVSRFLGKEALKTLMDYVIDRHYPEIKDSANPAIDLVKAVLKKQVDLINHWMRVGFIHGVMNTDNMSIPGETFDYGPCAFMNAYDPRTVFSSIDTQGRYAFGNQPRIAHWNLAVFASSLISLFHEEEAKAIELGQEALNIYSSTFNQSYYQMMGRKIGLSELDEESDYTLIDDLLKIMEQFRVDYTNFFIALTMEQEDASPIFQSSEYKNWHARWYTRKQQLSAEQVLAIMRASNPSFIPRNHLVEKALEEAVNGDWQAFDQLLADVKNPYQYPPKLDNWQAVPEGFDQQYQTFCGT